MITIEDRIEALDVNLPMRWLRPETALNAAYDSPIGRYLLGDQQAPSLDLGCGDGTTSFLTCQGRFSFEFDRFRSVFLKDERAYVSENKKEDDYYDFLEKDARICQAGDIERPPKYRYTYGLDWKESLVRKAGQLGLYDHLITHDANKPFSFFKDGQFNTIFSNIIYWVENLEGLLSEVSRILAPGGSFVVTCPNDSIRDGMIYKYQRDYGLEWVKDLDRGRCNSYHHAYSKDGWIERFEKAGLKVVDHIPWMTDIILQINEIGLRPIFPTLMNIYTVLKTKAYEDFIEIKRAWVANFRHFLVPLLDEEWMRKFDMNYHWHAFRLTR